MPGHRFRKSLATAVVALVAAPIVTACTAEGDPDPDGGPRQRVEQFDGALWRAEALGGVWQDRAAGAATPSPPMLTDWCDGVVQREIPGDPEIAQVRLLAKGDTGTDWLDQTALVYPDSATASATLAGMREQATACPASAEVPRQTIGPDTVMDAHTRTVTVSDFTLRDWSGFVSAIGSEYPQADAARGDNRVFALARGNAVLIVMLGTLRLGNETRMNWAPVVASIVEPILARVDGETPGATASAGPTPTG